MITAFLLAAAPIVTAWPDTSRLLDYYGKASTAVVLEIVLTPKGKMQTCAVTSTVGSAELARKTCSMMTKARWKIAKDAAGAPVHGLVRFPLMIWVEDTPEADEVWEYRAGPMEAELEVNKLPDGEESVTVAVGVLVDESGTVLGCDSQMQDDKLDAYAAIACKTAIGFPNPTVTDTDGKSVPYVRGAKVRFTRAGQQP